MLNLRSASLIFLSYLYLAKPSYANRIPAEYLLEQARSPSLSEDARLQNYQFPEWTGLLEDLSEKYRIGKADIRVLGQFIANTELYDSSEYSFDRLLYQLTSFLFYEKAESALALIKNIDTKGLSHDQARMIKLLHLSALIEVEDRSSLKSFISALIDTQEIFFQDDRIIFTTLRALKLLSPNFQLEILLQLTNSRISKHALDQVYQQLVRIDAKQVPVAYSKLRILTLASDLNRGLHDWLVKRAIDGALAGVDSNEEVFQRLRLLLRLGENHRAIEIASRELKIRSNTLEQQVSYITILLDAFMQLDELDDTLALASKALVELGYQKKTIPVWERYAMALSESAEYRAAANEYKKIIKLDGQRHFRWYYFWNLYRAKDYKQALALIESLRRPELYSRDFREPEGIYYWQGKTLLKLGRKKQANALFKKMLEHHGDGFYANLISENFTELVSENGQTLPKPTRRRSLVQYDDYVLWRENRNFYLDEIRRHTSFLSS